ncbi:TPA: hypothetical protein ACN33E_001363 [Vibrio parahaemolyticus]|nr:hypothetical protein [Vibrio parahaemolyticus]
MGIFTCNKCRKFVSPNILASKGGICPVCFQFLAMSQMHPKIWDVLHREIEEGNQIVGFNAIGALGGRCISIELKYPFSNSYELNEGLIDYVDNSSSGNEWSMYVGIEYRPIDGPQGSLKIKSVLRYTNQSEAVPGDHPFSKLDITYLRVLLLLLSILIVSIFVSISMFPEFYHLLIKVLIPVLVLRWALNKY